jgi:hypothetical protein
LADSICPVILPIAILFSPYRDNLVLKLEIFTLLCYNFAVK